MGVRVGFGYCAGDRTFADATDWYVTDERVLQIYQERDRDPEFVIAEYNRDGWESVEWDPPIPAEPQPEEGLIPGKWYREHTPEQLLAEYKRRGITPPVFQTIDTLADGLNEDDKKAGTKDAEGNEAEA